eukprot:scaffold4193_cov68-Cylindrotheca_fusiformis.AAC.1
MSVPLLLWRQELTWNTMSHQGREKERRRRKQPKVDPRLQLLAFTDHHWYGMVDTCMVRRGISCAGEKRRDVVAGSGRRGTAAGG